MGKYLMLLPVLIKLIKTRKQYDLILVSGLRLLGIPGMIVARLLGKKCVLRAASCGELSGEFIWNSPHLEKKPRKIGFYKLLVGLRNKILLKADGFLGISDVIGDEYRNCGIIDDKISVINNGTDTDKFKPAESGEKDALRTQLNLSGGTVFAYSGKLNKGKGLEFLLNLWNTFCGKHENVHLLLIGSGKNSFLSCEDELRAYVIANRLERTVTFTGYVKNVQEYLQASDVFVFPSENESLSNALIEALSCGLPCLASNTGGIPDTVKDGVNGRLLTVGDESAWLDALEQAVVDKELLGKWSRQGRERVLERNSIKTVAEKHLDFIKSV